MANQSIMITSTSTSKKRTRRFGIPAFGVRGTPNINPFAANTGLTTTDQGRVEFRMFFHDESRTRCGFGSCSPKTAHS